MALLLWYRQEGRHLPFSMLHLIEWDLLLLASPERIQHNGHWTSAEPYATHWRQLQEHVHDRYGWQGPHFACQGPANAFSKAFLERHAQEEVPELVHDELRIPLHAQAMGFEMEGLPGIYRTIGDPSEMKFFNCEKQPIKHRTFRWELLKQWGRRCSIPRSARLISGEPAPLEKKEPRDQRQA